MGSWSKLMLQLQRHSSSKSWRVHVFTYNLCSDLKELEHHCLLSGSLRGPV